MGSSQNWINLHDAQHSPATSSCTDSTRMPVPMPNEPVADNALSLNTSPTQQSNEIRHGNDDHSLHNTILGANTITQVPSRDFTEDILDPGNDHDDYHEAQVATPHKRQKAPVAATPHKRQKIFREEVNEDTPEAIHGNGEASIDERLPYRSIKTIAIPPRPNPQREPVENDPTTYYGDMNYVDSMMTYWLDEVGYGYQKTADLCTKKIKQYTYEGVRKRHIAALLVHLRKYGRKALADIPPPINEKVKNRGKPRAIKKPTNKNAETLARAGTGKAPMVDNSNVQRASVSTSTDKALPVYAREAPFRQLEATAIVVCKDLFKMEFPQIRDLMERAYDFPMDEKNIENYYHAARPSAWGSKYHGYSNIDDNLDQDTLSEKRDSEAASKALLLFSQNGTGDAQQIISRRRPPIKISQINRDGKGQLLVAPASPSESRDGNIVEFEHQPADIEGRSNIEPPEILAEQLDGQTVSNTATVDKVNKGDSVMESVIVRYER